MIFIDTSAFVAAELPRDVHHQSATEIFHRIATREFGTPITSDYVISESLTHCRMRDGMTSMRHLEQRIFDSPTIMILWTGPTEFKRGLDLMKQHDDKRWSLTDCISFWQIETMGIETAFSYDKDFIQAGFDTVS